MKGVLRTLSLVLAALIMLVLVLIVAFTFIGLYRMSEYYSMFCTMRAPRAKVSDIYPALKTGDVLLFVATCHAPSNSMLTQTFYSHTGVLLREGDLLYISEASAGGELMPDPRDPAESNIHMHRGADLTPFLTRLKYYTGDCYVMRLSHPLDAGREEKLKSTAERLYAAHYPYPTVFQILLGMAGRSTASRHCFQHSAHLIDEARLTPLDRAAPLAESGFAAVCREVCDLPGRPLPDGYSYLPPVQLVYDIGTLSFDPPGPPPDRGFTAPAGEAGHDKSEGEWLPEYPPTNIAFGVIYLDGHPKTRDTDTTSTSTPRQPGRGEQDASLRPHPSPPQGGGDARHGTECAEPH